MKVVYKVFTSVVAGIVLLASTEGFSRCSNGQLICMMRQDGLDPTTKITYTDKKGKQRTIDPTSNPSKFSSDDIKQIKNIFYSSQNLANNVCVPSAQGGCAVDATGKTVIGAQQYARKYAHGYCNPCISGDTSKGQTQHCTTDPSQGKSTIEPHLLFCNQLGGVWFSIEVGSGTSSNDVKKNQFDLANITTKSGVARSQSVYAQQESQQALTQTQQTQNYVASRGHPRKKGRGRHRHKK